MEMNFRATTPDDRVSLITFLMRVFHTQPGTSLDDPALVQWRFWQPRADWTEPRSYVLEQDGQIVAHAGLWPMVLAGVRGVHMIDWAADKSHPGAGLSLMQEVADRFDFIYSIGGSDATQKLLPAFGFKEVARVWTGARPLHPLAQIVTHQTVNWKLAPRFVRNSFWSRYPPQTKSAGWKLLLVSPEDVRSDSQSSSDVTQLCSPRNSSFFEYVVSCPSGSFHLYRMALADEPQGYLVLGVVRNQARIAGVWLKNADAERWRIAYTLAETAARRLEGANEIAVRGSVGPGRTAAEQAGFKILQHHETVYLLNKKNKLSLPENFQFQMIDDDAFVFDSGAVSYYT